MCAEEDRRWKIADGRWKKSSRFTIELCVLGIVEWLIDSSRPQLRCPMNALQFPFFRRVWLFDLKLFVAGLIFSVRRLLTKWRHRGRGGENPGLSFAGKPVPIRPTPTHHLVAAKEFPPSNKTQSYR